jgi:4-amino-4-deoxy-L-arabinose transferase-like glycosyltransferase
MMCCITQNFCGTSGILFFWNYENVADEWKFKVWFAFSKMKNGSGKGSNNLYWFFFWINCLLICPIVIIILKKFIILQRWKTECPHTIYAALFLTSITNWIIISNCMKIYVDIILNMYNRHIINATNEIIRY